jgi:hypothetical protein
MHGRELVDAQVYKQPLLRIQLAERKAFYPQSLLDPPGSEIVMQVDYIIVIFRLKLTYKFRQAVLKVKAPVQIRVVFEDRFERFLRNIVQADIFDLLLYTSDNRRSKDDVADGTKANDKNFQATR